MWTGEQEVQPDVRSCRDGGATAVEYALMVTFIAIAIVVAVTALGTSLTTVFNNMAAGI